MTFQLIPVLQAGHAKVSALKHHAWLVTVVAEQLGRFLLSITFIKNDLSFEPYHLSPPLINFSLSCYSLEILVLPVLSKQGLSAFSFASSVG